MPRRERTFYFVICTLLRPSPHALRTYICLNHNPMRFILSFFAIALSINLCAQVPALIPYQAVARDAAGQPLANSNVNARFTIHDGIANGASVWQELQTVSTNALGLFTAQLGSIVSLNNVNWAGGAKFMQVEVDLGSGFVEIGTLQMLSVPYALYSGGTDFRISDSGDTLFMGNGRHMIIPGLSANNPYNGNEGAPHSCGTQGIHNPRLAYGSMTDQEGNTYKTIVIGTHEWMAENLNTSIYRNGDLIESNINAVDWETTTNGAWSYYNNDTAYACPFGKLYNWYACADARNLCPTGWHVPSDVDWYDVITSLIGVDGSEGVGGSDLKTTGVPEPGSGFWSEYNQNTNSSGFSAVPGGRRTESGQYDGIDYFGHWWSSVDVDSNNAYSLILESNFSSFNFYGRDMRLGYSVRCVKD
jgi:uncharacterized protein (TIGR02145 family)